MREGFRCEAAKKLRRLIIIVQVFYVILISCNLSQHSDQAGLFPTTTTTMTVTTTTTLTETTLTTTVTTTTFTTTITTTTLTTTITTLTTTEDLKRSHSGY